LARGRLTSRSSNGDRFPRPSQFRQVHSCLGENLASATFSFEKNCEANVFGPDVLGFQPKRLTQRQFEDTFRARVESAIASRPSATPSGLAGLSASSSRSVECPRTKRLVERPPDIIDVNADPFEQDVVVLGGARLGRRPHRGEPCDEPIGVNSFPPQDVTCRPVVGRQGEQKMFGSCVVVPQRSPLGLSVHDKIGGGLRESFEHA
jgi:hypothetical protein